MSAVAAGAEAGPLVVAKSPVRLRALLGLELATGAAALAHLVWGRVGGRGGHALATTVLVGTGAGLGRLASATGWTHPALVLTPDALHDHASGASVGELPWSEVTGVGVRHLPGSDVLQLQVVDEQALVDRLGPLSRFVVELNRRRLGAPVNVPLAACALGPAALRAEVEARVEQVARA